MEKFIFRFDTILNTKEKIEEDRKNKLGISMKKLVTEQEHLQRLFQKKNDMVNQWQEKSSKIVKISELRSISNNLDIMQNIIDKQLNVVEQSELETENRRKQLLEASKQKKVFEKLKEKDYEEHKYNQLKKEDALTDEIVSYKAVCR
ncbi:flagellar export protein FliJ [Alkaliphilus sp. MSJ-5]|uniref:Flagellar export protein FliJ n=1 Tax=Alkaliphilus flagellatus TaxID=2841507 RepID=A0ABS6G7K5_9FIRM|nr:flagellar export protein FliJ [Alkaliphilus flagellatus]MBU5677415.1 flagellar export protein FliJ [Alkaliphilus flagellatus]